MKIGNRAHEGRSIAPFLMACLLTTSIALAVCVAPTPPTPIALVPATNESLALILAAEGFQVCDFYVAK